jgi:hypothetical protein
MGYKVTVAVDSLDPSPEETFFDDFDDAQDFVHETVDRAVMWRVEHSPYTVTQKERDDMWNEEMQLVTLVAV